METQVIEGTVTEIQQQLKALHVKAETHLRVVVSETGKSCAPEEFFANAPRRNGLIMPLASGLATTEMVVELLYLADLKGEFDEVPAELVTPEHNKHQGVTPKNAQSSQRD